MKSLLSRLTPTILVSAAVATLALVAAFGVTLTAVEQGAIVAFVGAAAVVLLLHRTVESVTALIAAGIAAAVAFGLPVTAAQEESILILAAALASVVVGKAGVQAVKAKRAGPPAPVVGGVRTTFTESAGNPVASWKVRAGDKVQETSYDASSKTLRLSVEKVPPAVTSAILASTHRKKKGGRLPGRIPEGLKTMMEYATKTLTAPGTFAAPAGSYPMDNNDVEGDCTVAGVAHLLQAWNRLYHGKARIPLPATIRKAYRALTGGGDTGLVEADVLEKWRTVGLFRSRIKAYAPVKRTDLNAVRCAVAFYGGCYLGIVVGRPQEEQFDRGEPWRWVPGQERDGHCVVAVGYTHQGLLCATWGGVALLPWVFLGHALEEAWVVLGPQLAAAGADTLGLDVAQLEQDLPRV